MSAARPLSMAVVGCGVISSAHGSAAKNLGGRVRLVACVDVLEEKARGFAGQFGAERTYTDYRQMLEAERPELVVLATWPTLHEEQVLLAVEAGVRGILCEKSMAMSAPGARRMADAADAGGVALLEGFMWRHHPRTLEAARLLDAGRIGALQKLRAVFQRNAMADPPGSWKHRPEAGGGVVFDFCCYCVNAAGAFFAELPERVSASWRRNENGLITDLNAVLDYAGGGMAVIESSYRLAFLQQIELYGAEGILRIGNCFTPGNLDGIEATPTPKARSFEPVPAPAAVQADCQLAHLLDHLQQGTPLRFSARESVRNHAVIDAMLASAGNSSPVIPQLP